MGGLHLNTHSGASYEYAALLSTSISGAEIDNRVPDKNPTAVKCALQFLACFRYFLLRLKAPCPRQCQAAASGRF